MHDVMTLLMGVIAGALMNFGVQLLLECIRSKRALQLAASVVYDELMEHGYREINSDRPVPDASELHAAWREHRARLVALGEEAWRAVDDAVTNAAYPELQPPRRPESHNSILERALYLLEPHAQLPEPFRGFA